MVALKPIGLKVISPTEWKKYVATNQNMPTLPLDSTTILAAKNITKKPIAIKIRPIPNFIGVDGLRFLAASFTQRAPSIGAKMMIKPGFTF